MTSRDDEKYRELKEKTFTNINPTERDLRDFAYSMKYQYIEQDWDICAVNYDHRHLYLEFGLDENCRFKDLFLNMLYVLVGSLVYEVISSPVMYDEKKDKIYYDKPIKKKGQPIPRDVQNNITTILTELKSVEHAAIKRLCQAIEDKIINADSGFDYAFWFQHGWKR